MCEGQVRAQPRQPVQRMESVHPGTVVCGPLHRDPRGNRAAPLHVATLHVDMWTRNPARAKRYSGAHIALIPSTRTSMRRRTSWPQGLRSPPVKTPPSFHAWMRRHRSRNQQETARNYCSNHSPQRDRLESPGQPRGGRQYDELLHPGGVQQLQSVILAV
jgi:hypothetical protein